MINFDAVDFSERHPEEVMFLLTLSVHRQRHSYITHRQRHTYTQIETHMIVQHQGPEYHLPSALEFEVLCTIFLNLLFVVEAVCVGEVDDKP